jgi:hypothetical protein
MAERYAGDWWLPNGAEHITKGILEVDDSGRMSLELLGTLGEPGRGSLAKVQVEFETAGVHPLLHGVGRGTQFTLLECFQTTANIYLPAGTSSETLHVGRALRGAHLTSEDLEGFTSIWFEIDGTVEWMGTPGSSCTHTEPPADPTISLTVGVMPEEVLDGPDATKVVIRHAPRVSTEGLQKSLLQHAFSLAISSTEPRGLDDLLARASDLQDLISVGTGKAAGFRKVHVCHPGLQVDLGGKLAELPIEVLAAWTVPRGEGPRSRVDVVFTHHQLGGATGVASWLRAAAKHQRSLDRVMATRYAETMFVTDRLMNYAASLDAFDHVDHPDPERGKRVPYKTRLGRCAAIAGDSFSDLVGDRDRWVSAFKEARDDVAHHRPAIDDSSLHYYLAESAYWLYILCLLREAQAPDEVFEAIATHRSWGWLRRRLQEALDGRKLTEVRD